MKRTGRIISVAVVCLAIGAAVNVVVAWGCFVLVEEVQATSVTTPAAWPRPVPERWPECEVVVRRDGPGVRWIAWHGRARRSSFPYDSYDYIMRMPIQARAMTAEQSHECTIVVQEAGWPRLSLRRESWSERTSLPGPPANVDEGHPRSPWRVGAAVPWADGLWIPVRPVWSGFAINALLYAILAILVWRATGACGRGVRRWRGQCAGCGYSRMGLAVNAPCPECGEAPKP